MGASSLQRLLAKLLTAKFAAIATAVAAIASPTVSAPGIELFRKVGKDGQRCADCHSPDGIEIGVFNFPQDDIERRARNHLDAADARRIAGLLTKRPSLSHPVNPETERPLQPGHFLLPGETAVQRDGEFAAEIAKLVPGLGGPPIRTKAQAFKTRDRLLALDPRTVPVGIPFNHLSEDVFHGPAHATIADWIPDVGIGLTPEILRLQDAYLAKPTEQNLADLEKSVAGIVPKSQIHQLALAKYRALLLLTHAIRKGGPAAIRMGRVKLIGPGNPFWDIAEVTRLNTQADPRMLAMPESVSEKKRDVPLAQQFHELRLPWFWAGWTVDPTLSHIPAGFSRTGVRGDYFTDFLWSDGPYPAHMAYMMSKKLVDSAYGPQETPSPIRRHYELQFSNFLLGDHLTADDPNWRSIRPKVFKLADNAFRLSLLLLQDDIEKTGACLRPESQLTQIEAMRRFFRVGGEQKDLDLCDAIAVQLKTARVEGR